jgi:hypothetical protein
VVIGGIAQIVTLGVASVATAGVGVLGILMLVFVVKETMSRTPPKSSRGGSGRD